MPANTFFQSKADVTVRNVGGHSGYKMIIGDAIFVGAIERKMLIRWWREKAIIPHFYFPEYIHWKLVLVLAGGYGSENEQ